jgi:XTP/dITP diphosphohydrolase
VNEPVVLATTNAGKVEELRSLLPAWKFVPRPSDVPDVDETEDTFEGNARLKAQALVDATGMAAMADDSGLEVDALDGAPGVRSARFAGDDATDADNVHKLLSALRDVPAERRTARFRTVIVLLFPDGMEVTAHGAVEGRIIEEPRGANGFGYDPIFVADEIGDRTFAEMAREEKNRISHRANALRELVRIVET